MKKKVLDYTLYVTGLFGRNRKVKSESFDLLKDQENPAELGTIRELMEKKIAEIKVKGPVALRVSEQECEVSHDGIFTSRMFQLFTDKKLIEEKRA